MRVFYYFLIRNFTMFYKFSQNNSGGFFDIDDTFAPYVLIEANTPAEANRKAEEIGIYFDGCEKDIDCPCCGDRWYEIWSGDVGTEFPMIRGLPVEESDDFEILARDNDPCCHIYYADGTKKSYMWKE